VRAQRERLLDRARQHDLARAGREREGGGRERTDHVDHDDGADRRAAGFERGSFEMHHYSSPQKELHAA